MKGTLRSNLLDEPPSSLEREHLANTSSFDDNSTITAKYSRKYNRYKVQTVLQNEYESYVRDSKEGIALAARHTGEAHEKVQSILTCLRINYRLTNVHQEDDGLVDAARA